MGGKSKLLAELLSRSAADEARVRSSCACTFVYYACAAAVGAYRRLTLFNSIKHYLISSLVSLLVLSALWVYTARLSFGG